MFIVGFDDSFYSNIEGYVKNKSKGNLVYLSTNPKRYHQPDVVLQFDSQKGNLLKKYQIMFFLDLLLQKYPS